MKQVIRRGLREIIVDEVADPKPSSNHVLVHPLYSLISSGTETADIHTDSLMKEVADNPSHLRKVWNIMQKTDPISTFHEVRAKFAEYAVLGYSGAGIIVEKHPTVLDLSLGQRVAYGGEGTGHGETINVGRNLIARVPDNVPFQDACFTTLGSIAMNAVRQAEIQIGESVVVMGLGLVGQLISQLVRCQGGIVIASDLMRERVELAQKLGADFGVMAGETAVAETNALTQGRGADCVIVAVASKSSAPVKQAIQMSRERGRLVIVGACPLDLSRDAMYAKELKLLMARAYGPGSYDQIYEKQGIDYPFSYVRWTENRNMEEFLRLLSVGKVNVKPLVTHEFNLVDAPKGYEAILNPETKSLAVLLRYPANDTQDAIKAYKPTRKIELPNVAEAAEGILKIGLVGAGNLAKWAHLPAINKIGEAKLHAVCSSSGARGKSYALRFGAKYASSDYEEMVKDPDIDVILVSSASHHHARETILALRSGKHVFVEKPMAVSIAECREIYQAVRETGKQVCVGFNRRFAPCYLEMKRQLAGRSVPMIVTTRMNSPGMRGGFWGGDPKFGGATVGEGCHFIDLMYWLTAAEPVSVSAHCLPIGSQEPLGVNNLAASIRFADGSVGSFLYSTVGSESSGGEYVEAFSQGVGVSSEDFKQVTVKKSSRKSKKMMFADKGYVEQMKSFVGSLRSGKAPAVSVIDGARATIVCLLMIESARIRRTIEFDLIDILENGL
ncbi:MAG: bi-domain-containing oxidoreductase [Nitrospira sp.]|jgi:predicted dehydrogenase/threonine dehydrogenase-like Zn-dependent dehydrogenase|nr:bi-domain-containing oxidoreductase [Nitrospira sp.]